MNGTSNGISTGISTGVSPRSGSRLRAFEIEADASSEYTAPTISLASTVGEDRKNGLPASASGSFDPNAYDNEFEFDPHAGDVGGGDLTSAVLGIVKAMVGPAILYLPHGFVKAGYLVALPIMAISTAMYLHSSKCLMEVWKFESQKTLVPQQESTSSSPNHNTTHHNHLSYPDLAYRAFGSRGETLVKVGIALMQSGVCLTYLIFVPHNLHTSIKTILGWDLPTNLYLFLMVLLQIRLSFIQDIRKFTTTNAIANACILYGLLICLFFAFGQATAPLPSSSSHNGDNDNSAIHNKYTTTSIDSTLPDITYPTTDYSSPSSDYSSSGPLTNLWDHFTHLQPLGDHWILFIGTSVLLFEGSITLLLPLQQAVQEPQDRELFPTVYQKVILAIQAFYVVFAVSCWMSFGDSVNTVLTTSLPPGYLATTVQLAYSVAVLFTFPLQNYPALEIASKSIQEYFNNITARQGQAAGAMPVAQQSPIDTCLTPPARDILRQRHIIATILVCILAIVAVTTMEALDKVVSLTGALIGIPIAFMIPPMIHSQLMASQASPQRLQLNFAVTLLGSIAMVVASITTILQWND